ncbi:unnamed protein product [Cyprideis torosa]|uniref:Amino acid transporter n=1 Tax=Cyprideis torosa TaxID=163714 RepID=A0A7R8WCX6_9CRUS|nr:unnamed protein product [Cyprideis torosa]CAG0894015.1 unnamed protein product [Cyprideis torosa]
MSESGLLSFKESRLNASFVRPSVAEDEEGGVPDEKLLGTEESSSTMASDSMRTKFQMPTMADVGAFIRRNLLLIVTITGVFVGVVLGFIIRQFEPSSLAIRLISYPGEIFMRLLKLMILPLVISSLIAGTDPNDAFNFLGAASLNAKIGGKIAVRTIVYFLSTSLLNAILGAFLAIAINPGMDAVDEVKADNSDRKADILDSFMDLGR